MPDYIFEEALKRLRTGESVLSISQSFPEHKETLESLLPIAALTMSIPKMQPPVPHRQYRFVKEIQSAPYRFAGIFQFMRMAVIPISLVAALLGGKLVVNATANSLPGDKLYTLKRATEEARLNLSMSDSAAATIHVELVQKRLEEVKKAIDSKNSATETAAIEALQKQTEKTFAVASQVAAVNAVTNKDSSLLDNLVAINKEQKSVLASIEIGETDGTKEATKTALNTTAENDKTIAKLIATVNEQTLIDLPNKISITGLISSLKPTSITVEKNTFIIDEGTIINGTDGSVLDALPKDTANVTVIGTRSDKGLFAKKITLIELAATPSTTPTPSVSPSPTVKGVVTPKPTPTNENPTPTPTPTNEASGSFIVEPSAEQYAP